MKEFKLESSKVKLVGGGGGASVLVPFVAKQLNLDYQKADYAEVISSIGVASSMMQEQLEETVVNPNPEQISKLHKKIHDIMIEKGSTPESISIDSVYIPEKSLLRVTAFGNVELDNRLTAKNIFSKDLSQDVIENIVKKNWSLCLRWFFRMQIPLILSYNKFFSDILSFHIVATVLMNHSINLSKRNVGDENLSRKTWVKNLILEGKKSPGLSAMSISDMTNIPRATVIRKCKTLIKKNVLLINDKKQYFLGGESIDALNPHHALVLKDKSKFLRKVLNLIMIS